MTAYLYQNSQDPNRKSSSARFAGRTPHPTEESEVDLQELYENNNYHKALDPEDFSLDRGWWYRCRSCDLNTRVTTRVPRCRHCGFTQQARHQKKEST